MGYCLTGGPNVIVTDCGFPCGGGAGFRDNNHSMRDCILICCAGVCGAGKKNDSQFRTNKMKDADTFTLPLGSVVDPALVLLRYLPFGFCQSEYNQDNS